MMMRADSRGFTLLETVIALAIAGVVLVVLLAAMRLGHKAQDRGLRQHELDQHVRILQDRIAWLIRGAYPYLVTDEDDESEERLLFEGDENSLGFVTSSTDPYSDSLADLSGLRWVSISSGAGGLVMSERIFFLEEDPEGTPEFSIDPSVTKIVFEYLDAGSDEDEDEGEGGGAEASAFEWRTSWDSREKLYLPAAIRATVTIALGQEGETARQIGLPPIVARIRAGGRAIGAKQKG